jgi:hypothetical protein
MKKILKYFSIILIKYLQKRYKKITIDNYHNQNNQVLAKLKLIQAILFYFKSQFHAWGYFQLGCTWSDKKEEEFIKLFPQKDEFRELPIIVWHNPQAVTYYQNKIFKLTKGNSPCYEREIKKQLIEWKDWN